jgi:hypothetical protein
MALRAVPDHPKFAALKARLSMNRAETLGYLECMWHFCGRFTPQGNIGKYTDAQIESWIEWRGEPGALIAALVSEKWIDRDDSHRLIVHDWHLHADKATKNALKRTEKTFVDASYVPCTDAVRTVSPKVSAPYRLPEPVPEPEPVPVPEPEISEAKASSPRKDSGKPDPIEEIYKAYPRKVGKKAAIKAILRGVQHLKARGMPIREAEVYLFRRVQSYARSPAGNDGEFTPHPATWFNRGSYDDDPQEWQRKTSERNANGNQGRNGFSGEEMSRLLDSFGGSETDQPLRGG